MCGNGVEDKISWGGSGAVALLLAEDSYSFMHVACLVQLGADGGGAWTGKVIEKTRPSWRVGGVMPCPQTLPEYP